MINSTSISTLTTSDLGGSCNHRTVYSIVWSCLTTIFLCTWVSLHPNLPSKFNEYSLAHKLGRKAGMLWVSILMPEHTTIWAWRQWRAAKRITNEFEAAQRSATSPKTGWTNVHSFLALMGGIVQVEISKQEQEPEAAKRARRILPDGYAKPEVVNWIGYNIPRRRISDRSKGDWLAKSLVLVQTTWFIIQFSARLQEGLKITELELITLAYAVLNFGTYYFWWEKPLNIDVPFCLRTDNGDETDVSIEDCDVESITEFNNNGAYFARILGPLTLPVISGMDLIQDKVVEGRLLLRYFHGDNSDIYVIIFSFVILVFFGAFHCSAWFFVFPSQTEQVMWRRNKESIVKLIVSITACLKLCINACVSVDLHLVLDACAQIDVALVAVLNILASLIVGLSALLIVVVNLTVGLVADLKVVALVKVCLFLGISV